MNSTSEYITYQNSSLKIFTRPEVFVDLSSQVKRIEVSFFISRGVFRPPR